VRSIEICAGAGGQALGLEQAGFNHIALVEIDSHACATLRKNRPNWNVIEGDLKAFSAKEKKYANIDLFAGGVPCPPFSVAGKQLGQDDERDLFPEAIRLIKECSPKAVMLENVKGLFDPKFAQYRENVMLQFEQLGYKCFWELLHAHHYSVSQKRPRTILVALKELYAPYFVWPVEEILPPLTVGQLLLSEMTKNGWKRAETWAKGANDIAPTIVGGSKKHGGADLGTTRARLAWEKLGVDGLGLADNPPEESFVGNPKLTLKMTALLQGFPENWEFIGKKTPAYRQVGNAFPPPVAKAIGLTIKKALLVTRKSNLQEKVS